MNVIPRDNYRFLKDCSNLMRRMNCMRRCRIHGDNIVSLLHGIAFHPATHQQSSKSNHYVISLGDTQSHSLFVLRRHEVRK